MLPNPPLKAPDPLNLCRAVLELISAPAVVIDVNTTVLFANKEFEILCGVSRRKLEGKQRLQDFVREGDRADLESFLGKLQQEPVSTSFECCLIDSRGAAHGLLFSTHPLAETQMRVCSFSPVSRTSTLSSREGIGEDRFRALFELTPDGCYLCDLAGRFVDVNRTMENLTGYRHEELVGRSFFDLSLLNPEQILKATDLWNRGAAGEATGPEEFLLRRKGGGGVTLEIRTYSVRIDGALLILGLGRDITAHKRSQREYQLLFETMAQGVVYHDGKGEITSANPAAQRILGLSIEELQGWNAGNSHWRAIREDGSAFPVGTDPAMMALRTGMEIKDVVMGVFNPRLGKYRWINIHAIPLFRPEEETPWQITTTFDDITARKIQEEAVRENEERFRRIFEEAPMGMALLGQDYRLLKVNRAFCNMLGYSEEELSTMNLKDITFPGRLLVGEIRLVKLLMNGRSPRFRMEKRLIRRDGEIIWVDLTTTGVYGRDAKALYALGMVENITERKKAQEKIADYTQQLKSLSRRLLNAQESERRRIAHELHDEIGQTLTAVKIGLATLKRSVSPPLTLTLEESLQAVDRLLRNVRDLSLDLRPALLDDLGLVAALRWYLGKRMERAGLSVHLLVDPPAIPLAPEIATACFRVVQEALTNIMRHADAREVTVEVRRKTGKLLLRIRDDGVGFDVPAARNRAFEGESFGLLGMRERVQLTGGRFFLRSTPKHGTTVMACFSLPEVDE